MTQQLLGLNINQTFFYGLNAPYLNLVNGGGGNNDFTGWYSSTIGTTYSPDTGESAYIPLDSNGYCTNTSGAAVGKTFTCVKTLLFYTATAAPNTPTVYKAGTYRLQFTGNGTVTLSNDASTLTNPTGAGYSISGTALTITDGGTHSMIFSCTGNGGMILQVVTGSGSYPTAISVVFNAYVSLYDGGQRWNPDYLTALAPFASFRFMDAFSTNKDVRTGFNASGNVSIASGATSFTAGVAWAAPAQTKTMYFANGDVRSVSFTPGATTFSWTGGLSSAVAYVANRSQCWVSWRDTFSARSLPSNPFWNLPQTGGIPYEIAISLCNQLSGKCWINLPVHATDSDLTALANLIHNGTGIASGYSPLNPNLELIFEYSNEAWNPGFNQYGVIGYLGKATWPSAVGGSEFGWNRNYVGFRTAVAAELFAAVWGVNPNFVPYISAAEGSPNYAQQSLVANYWTGTVDGYTGPPTAHPIKAHGMAPYYGYQTYSAPMTWTFTASAGAGSTSLVWSGAFPTNGAYVVGCAVTGTGILSANATAATIAGNTLTLGGTITGTWAIGMQVSSFGGKMVQATIVAGAGAIWTISGSPQTVASTSLDGSTVITAANYGTNTLTLSVATSAIITAGTITADDSVMLDSQADGGVTYFFNSMTTQLIWSTGSGGIMGQVNSQMTTYVTTMLSSNPTLRFLGYEGGNYLSQASATTICGLQSAMLAVQRDSRMKAVTKNWLTTQASIASTLPGPWILHQYFDIGQNTGNNNNWGAAESILQPLTPNGAANMPPKWQGMLNYIYGTNN